MIARVLFGTVRFAGSVVLWIIKRIAFAIAVALCLGLIAKCAHAANVPVRSGSAGMTSWNVQTSNLDRVVGATEASVQIGRDIIARIGYGGKAIGSVAAVEMASIGVADMAAVVARASGPAMIALMVGDLAVRGYQRCMESGSGWCKRAPVNPNEGDTGFNGYLWVGAGGNTANSPLAACMLAVAAEPRVTFKSMSQRSPTAYDCTGQWSPDMGGGGAYWSVSQDQYCVKGYTVQAGACKVDPSSPVNWLPASYPDIASAWNAQMAANPNRIPDYWKQMSPEEQAQAEQNSQAQPAQMTGSDTVSDPNVKSSTETKKSSDGTVQECKTTTAVTVQARPNTGDGAKDSPLNYKTTTAKTTVCPDGTTTTTTDQDSGNTGGGGQQQKDPDTPVVDTPLGDLPKLYDAKYKDGMLGVWKASKPNVQTTPFYQAIASLFPTLGGGTCPAFSLNLNVMPHGMFGVRTIDVSCSVFQVVGLIMLTTAAFTARKILF
ncbi:hypothetical protein ACEPMY_01255 [Ralstonia pseudosolanacearum]|uniref:hypothetical protein n=1 Tax=Ralstonia pseudosolanacearum TaxID=1310165 RepID=UPI003869D500